MPSPLPFSKAEQDALAHLGEPIKSRFMNARTMKERQDIAHEVILECEERLWSKQHDLANKRDQLNNLQRKLGAWDEIDKVAARPVQQKLNESCCHKLVEAIQAGDLILPVDDAEALRAENAKWFPSLDLAVFVVQHDWASAFANAHDFAEGEFRLPYTDQAFEFRISGHRVICCIGTDDGVAKAFIFFIETGSGWALCGYCEGDWTVHIAYTEICAPIFNLIRAQVRAIAIALDAEVAITDVVRAPHKLNRKRVAAGKLPIFDHHLISLANRKRTHLPEAGQTDEARRKRLHFVRGHWRHFATSKTWIKWHLRGNPDLGFIEKEYRL